MTDQELAEYSAYLKSKGASDADIAGYVEYLKSQMPQEKPMGVKDYALQGLDYAGRGMDYLGGLSRGAIAGLIEQGTGKELVNIEDVLRGQAPSSADIAEKLGATPGLATSAAGFGLDIATDPLTYVSFGSVPLLKALSKMPSRAMTKAGESMWRKGLARLDAEAVKQGVGAVGSTPVSDIALKQGIMKGWSAEQNLKQMSGYFEKLYDQQKALIKKATDAGAIVDPKEVTAPLRKYAQEIGSTRDVNAKALSDAMLERADEVEQSLARVEAVPAKVETRMVPGETYNPMSYTDEKLLVPKEVEVAAAVPGVPGATPADLQKVKQFLGDALQGSKWAAYKENPALEIGKKKLYQGAKNELEAASERALGTGAGETLRDINKQMQTILATRKKELGEVTKEAAKRDITSVDAAMAGLSLGSSLANQPDSARRILMSLASKKLTDLINPQGGMTGIGSSLYYGGKATPGKIADEAFYRSFTNLFDQDKEKEKNK